MGLCHAKASPSPSPNWLDLPPDLTSLILCRLTSHSDLLTFQAVCRDWRLAAQQQRGTTPWLNLGPGLYQSLADGKVHRFSRCHGSSSSWILLYHDPDDEMDIGDGDGLFLRNPFHPSAAPIQISWPYRKPSKIIFCSSSVAAILHGGICTTVPFWPANMNSGPLGCLQISQDYADIAFYRGRIFTVTHSGELFSHDLIGSRREHVMNQSVDVVRRNQPVDNAIRHLVVSSDKEKLLMVRWSIPRRKLKVRRSNPRQKATAAVVYDHRWAMNLHVFEADLAKGQWSEVKDLGGQVLFVSTSCCKAFGSSEHCHPRFPQGNLVYILGVDWNRKRFVAGADMCRCHDCRDGVNGAIPSYCVYDMTTDTLSLVSLGAGPQLESGMSEWFFPCECLKTREMNHH